MATRVTPRAGSASLHWHESRHGQPSVIADVSKKYTMKTSILILTTILTAAPFSYSQERVIIRGSDNAVNAPSTTDSLSRNYAITVAGALGQSDPIDVTLRGNSQKFNASLEEPNRKIEIIIREDNESLHVTYAIAAQFTVKAGEDKTFVRSTNVTGSFIAELGKPFPVLDVSDSSLTIQVDEVKPTE
jgi:hypothetical protein